nr:hypothetical protein [Tanacetum cinerariifolium]
MPPKPMSEARMREIIHDQFATSMNEFMANMNNGAGGSEGASGSGGAGGSGGTGGNADGTGVRGARPTVPELTGECKEKDREKFTMATLRGRALTWWNERTKAMGIEAANNTPWEPEAVKVEQYIWGLTKSIRGDATSSQPATINDAVRLAYQLVVQLIQDKTDEATEGEKRKGEEMSCYNCNEKGHRKRDCPKLGRNGQGGNNHGGVYQLGAVNA